MTENSISEPNSTEPSSIEIIVNNKGDSFFDNKVDPNFQPRFQTESNLLRMGFTDDQIDKGLKRFINGHRIVTQKGHNYYDVNFLKYMQRWRAKFNQASFTTFKPEPIQKASINFGNAAMDLIKAQLPQLNSLMGAVTVKHPEKPINHSFTVFK